MGDGPKLENGPIKYMWARVFALGGLFIIGAFGLVLLHMAYSGEMAELNTLLWGAGIIFTLFGFGICIEHYFHGITYYRTSRCPIEELDNFFQYDNGLLVALDNWAKLITYNHKKILDRGYIKIHADFDRKKKLKSWHILIN